MLDVNAVPETTIRLLEIYPETPEFHFSLWTTTNCVIAALIIPPILAGHVVD